MRPALLALADALADCPSPEAPDDPFADVYKDKQTPASGENADAPAAEPASPEAAPSEAAPRLVAVNRQATVRDPQDTFLHLRASASTRAEAVTRLISGSTVEVQACIPPQNGSRSRWCEVDASTVSDGALSGWIAESRLRYN